MRIRHAATALVALGSASACALSATLILQDREDDARESALRSSSWSVQASTDFGTTSTAISPPQARASHERGRRGSGSGLVLRWIST